MAGGRSGRIHLLDEIRGFMIICMVFSHAFYTMAYHFNIGWGYELIDLFYPMQPYFAGAFIFISGYCSRLSSSNLKRGGKLLAVSVALSIITYLLQHYGNMQGALILFGILHLLAVCMLLHALCDGFIYRINSVVGLIVCALLFVFTMNIARGYLGVGLYRIDLPVALYQSDWLMALGFHSGNFYSADYFPLLPWIFLFFGGSFVNGLFKKLPKFCYNQHIRPLAYCGRHSLIIYILHQPIIYGLLWIWQQIS